MQNSARVSYFEIDRKTTRRDGQKWFKNVRRDLTSRRRNGSEVKLSRDGCGRHFDSAKVVESGKRRREARFWMSLVEGRDVSPYRRR